MPKIAKGMAVFVFLWDRMPEAEAGRFAPITYDECHYLPRSTTHSGPQPPRLLFLLNKTPYLIKFEHIIRCRRQKRFFDIGQFLRMLVFATTQSFVVPWQRPVQFHADCNALDKLAARVVPQFPNIHALV